MNNAFCNVSIKSLESVNNNEVFSRIFNVIHDSSQAFCKIDNLFELNRFYHKEMEEYTYSLSGIDYQFDLELMKDFKSETIIKQKEDRKMTICGCQRSIMKLLKAVKEEATTLKIRITEATNADGESILDENGRLDPSKFKSTITESSKLRFLNAGLEAIWYGDDDKSYYEVTIEKLND